MRTAVSRPMPRDAPVTSTRLPRRSSVILASMVGLRCCWLSAVGSGCRALGSQLSALRAGGPESRELRAESREPRANEQRTTITETTARVYAMVEVTLYTRHPCFLCD